MIGRVMVLLLVGAVLCLVGRVGASSGSDYFAEGYPGLPDEAPTTPVMERRDSAPEGAAAARPTPAAPARVHTSDSTMHSTPSNYHSPASNYHLANSTTHDKTSMKHNVSS